MCFVVCLWCVLASAELPEVYRACSYRAIVGFVQFLFYSGLLWQRDYYYSYLLLLLQQYLNKAIIIHIKLSYFTILKLLLQYS